jgi:hypothetical protein
MAYITFVHHSILTLHTVKAPSQGITQGSTLTF